MDNKHLMPIQKPSKVYSPGHKYDPDQKEEEPKYIVAYDPVKDEGDVMSLSSCKIENGVVVNLQYKEKELDRLPDSIEKTDDVKSQVDTGGSFWDFFKHIGNSNICHFELVHPWHRRYENANIWQSYRDLGDGWYILLTINKESGIVAAFKIFDKYFDINSNADVNGHVLTLYSGNPKDMHEVEKIIKMNTGKTMMINPAPSFMDFIDHGVVVRDNDWLFSTKLAMIGFKDFDQHRRKLAKRRIKQDFPFTTGKYKSFYKRYKMV